MGFAITPRGRPLFATAPNVISSEAVHDLPSWFGGFFLDVPPERR